MSEPQKAYLDRFGIVSNNPAIQILDCLSGRRRFRKLHVANTFIFFRYFVLDHPNIFDSSVSSNRLAYFFCRRGTTAYDENTRERRIVCIYFAARHWANWTRFKRHVLFDLVPAVLWGLQSLRGNPSWLEQWCGPQLIRDMHARESKQRELLSNFQSFTQETLYAVKDMIDF